jgi:hypothetical protein
METYLELHGSGITDFPKMRPRRMPEDRVAPRFGVRARQDARAGQF